MLYNKRNQLCLVLSREIITFLIVSVIFIFVAGGTMGKVMQTQREDAIVSNIFSTFSSVEVITLYGQHQKIDDVIDLKVTWSSIIVIDKNYNEYEVLSVIGLFNPNLKGE